MDITKFPRICLGLLTPPESRFDDLFENRYWSTQEHYSYSTLATEMSLYIISPIYVSVLSGVYCRNVCGKKLDHPFKSNN